MMGSGTLYEEVSEAWENTGETKPLSVSRIRITFCSGKSADL